MSRTNNKSRNGSKNRDTEVYVVDFKEKTVVAVFINESDKTVLGYLNKLDMPRIENNAGEYSCECENVLRFHQKVA